MSANRKRQIYALCYAYACDLSIGAAGFLLAYYIIRDFNPSDDPTDIGTYQGYLLSARSVAQLVFALPWGYLSDRRGRRPTLLIGLLAASVSALALAFTRSYEWLFLIGVIQSSFSPSLVAVKSAIGDMTSGEEQVKAFGILYAALIVGVTGGQFVIGQLADLTTYFPILLEKSAMLRRYPYLVPFTFAAFLGFTGFLAILWCFEESLPAKQVQEDEEATASTAIEASTECEQSTGHAATNLTENSPLLPKNDRSFGVHEIKRVLMTLSDHTVLLVTMSGYALVMGTMMEWFSLFRSTPIKNGGLGLEAGASGVLVGLVGIAAVASQMLLYPYLNRRFGARLLARLVLLPLLPICVLLPILNLVARIGSTAATIWVWILLIGITCTIGIIQITISICMQLILTEAIGDSDSSGVINSASQGVISLIGVVVPLITGRTWSWAISNNNSFPFDSTLPWNVVVIALIILWFFSRRLT